MSRTRVFPIASFLLISALPLALLVFAQQPRPAYPPPEQQAETGQQTPDMQADVRTFSGKTPSPAEDTHCKILPPTQRSLSMIRKPRRSTTVNQSLLRDASTLRATPSTFRRSNPPHKVTGRSGRPSRQPSPFLRLGFHPRLAPSFGT